MKVALNSFASVDRIPGAKRIGEVPGGACPKYAPLNSEDFESSSVFESDLLSKQLKNVKVIKMNMEVITNFLT